MDGHKNIDNHFTTKSNQAIQNLSSMINDKKMIVNNLDVIEKIKGKLYGNVVGDLYGNVRGNVVGDISGNIGHFENIKTKQLCFDNNNCIDTDMFSKINKMIANEYIYFPNQMIIWDDLRQYMNKDIKIIPGKITEKILGNPISIPIVASATTVNHNFETANKGAVDTTRIGGNDKLIPKYETVLYAIKISKIDDNKYVYTFPGGSIIKINVPKPPQNANYNYTVLWLQLDKKNTEYIELLVNGIPIYRKPQNLNEQISENYNMFFEENMYTEMFNWIPIAIQNNIREINIEVKKSSLSIGGIAFSSNPLNHISFGYDYKFTFSSQRTFDSDYIDNINRNIIDRNIIGKYNFQNDYRVNDYRVNDYQVIEYINNNIIVKSKTFTEYISIPYIYSNNDKILYISLKSTPNSNINLSLKNNNNYINLGNIKNLNNGPIKKIFPNEPGYAINIKKDLLKHDKNFINIKLDIEYKLNNIYNFRINYPSNTEFKDWDWNRNLYLRMATITYNYIGSVEINNFSTYDALI